MNKKINIYDEFKKTDVSKEFEEYYNKQTVFQQINMFRLEDIHTNFLSNLFKYENIYGLGNKPLGYFLKMIGKEELFNENITQIEVNTRKSINRTKYKPDILITFCINEKKYLLIIENKVYSRENCVFVDDKKIGQCKLYENLLENDKEYENYEKLYAYLTLDPDEDISSEKYVRRSYKKLLNEVLEKIVLKDNIDNFNILEDYINSFKIFLIEANSNNVKNLPISNKISDMLKNMFPKIEDSIKRDAFNLSEINKEEDFFYLNLAAATGKNITIKNRKMRYAVLLNNSKISYGGLILKIIEKNKKEFLRNDILKEYKNLPILIENENNNVSSEQYYSDKNAEKDFIKINNTKYRYLKSWYFNEISDYFLNQVSDIIKNIKVSSCDNELNVVTEEKNKQE